MAGRAAPTAIDPSAAQGCPARRRGKADDEAHRPRRIGLRPCNARGGRESGGTRCQMQKLPSRNSSWRGPPLCLQREPAQQAAQSSVRSSVHSACKSASVRARGQRLPTLLRNFRSTSARSSAARETRHAVDQAGYALPVSRVAVRRVGGTAMVSVAKAGSSFTVILPMKARMRGSWSFSGA